MSEEHLGCIIIPYKNRPAHLMETIPAIRKLTDMDIIVVEQLNEGHFLFGAVKNAGVTEALSMKNYDYFVFQDVDAKPVTVDYSYSHIPLAMVTERHGKKMYRGFFGCVVLIPTKRFKTVEGYSNKFKKRGEDDEIKQRLVKKSGIQVGTREGIWEHLPHEPFPVSGYNTPEYKHDLELLNVGRDENDGLFKVRYIVKFVTKLPSYTHIGIWLLGNT